MQVYRKMLIGPWKQRSLQDRTKVSKRARSRVNCRRGKRTLDFGHALGEDLLQRLGVLQLLLHLGDDGLSQLLLLAGLDLALVADPGVEHGLGLGGQSSLLLELVGLGLELGGFLERRSQRVQQHNLASRAIVAYLGDLEQALGDLNDLVHLLDVVDAGLDGLGVVGTGSVQDASNLLALGIGPLRVHGTTVLDDGTPDAQQTKGDDGLLVDDIVLVAEGVDGQTGSGGQDGGLGDERVAGQGIEDGLGLLLGVFGRDVGRVAGRDEGGDGRESPGRDRRPQTGSPCGTAIALAMASIGPAGHRQKDAALTESGSSQAGRHCDMMSGVVVSLRLEGSLQAGAQH